MGDVLPPCGEAVKPLCGFCGGHHYESEEHPEEAVRAALAELRRTEPAESEFAVGRRTIAEVREHVKSSVTPPSEPVTSPGVTKEQAWRERNRDKVREANRERQRAYRERQAGITR